MLLALTALALALACVNVACLAAVRSAGREQEMTIRLAVGARRSRLERQLLTEGLVLAAIGGAAGVLIAPWAATVVVAAQSSALPIDGLQPRVLAFGVVVSLLTGGIVALLPILASRKIGLASSRAGPAPPLTVHRP